MRYYAHFGFKDFLLCLGYKADVIKEYFLRYNEALSNDFILSDGGRSVELLRTDIQDWRITFVDTGLHASIGERLRAVRRELANEELFLANYADVLTDAPMDELVADFRERSATAAFLSVRPTYTFHLVDSAPDGLVAGIRHVTESDVWINGGHFILRPSDVRLHGARRRACRAALRAAHRGRRTGHLPVRGILGADGHAQGHAYARIDVRSRSSAVGEMASSGCGHMTSEP